MAKKYKNSLLLVGFFLSLAFLLLCSYIKYKKEIESTSPLVLVENGLSINFLNGNKVVLSGENKTYTFSVTNNNESDLQYYISLEDIKANQETITYDLTEQNEKIKILKSDVTKENNTLASMMKIAAGETHFYTLILYENDALELKAKLNISVEEPNEEYFANTILKNTPPKKETLTKVGAEVATADEGLIEADDSHGTIYYFRGNVQNNYVSYANLLWRIVKINSDGSIRLVLNDYLDSTSNLNDAKASFEEKLDFSKSPLEETLKIWYDEHIAEYEGSLISNKYCVDDSVVKEEEGKTYYAGNTRLLSELTASPACLGKEYSNRISILSADEVILSGATTNANNTDFYLYLPEKLVSYWTSTPSFSDTENITYFEVTTEGKVVSENDGTIFKGIRPVLNLIKKTRVSGLGTSANPYTIK